MQPKTSHETLLSQDADEDCRPAPPSIRFSVGLYSTTFAGRLRLNWLRTECPGGVALRPIRAGYRSLTSELPGTQLLILQARERSEEGDNVINLRFTQCQRLHVFVEPGVSCAVTVVVMIHHIP